MKGILIKMILCEECNVRINSNHAIEEKTEMKHYCKKCFNQLFMGGEQSCMYCKHFKFARTKYHYLKSFTIIRTKEKGLWGECELHQDKKVTTHSKTCDNFKYAYNGDAYCTKEHIIKDCSINDNCHRAKHNCDDCFTKEFWENDVLKEKDNHVIGMEWSDGQVGVDYYTTGTGGYYDRRFRIEFEDGEILDNVGLWSRGRCPNKKVYNAIRHGKISSV